jgi:hypothetical protein
MGIPAKRIPDNRVLKVSASRTSKPKYLDELNEHAKARFSGLSKSILADDPGGTKRGPRVCATVSWLLSTRVSPTTNTIPCARSTWPLATFSEVPAGMTIGPFGEPGCWCYSSLGMRPRLPDRQRSHQRPWSQRFARKNPFLFSFFAYQ